MRIILALLASTTLAACGGGGLETVGSTATGSSTGTGTGGTTSAHTFVNPTEVKTYAAIGGTHSYQYTTNDIGTTPNTPGSYSNSQQYNQLYAGNASTARNSGISVTYDPRDAIFNIVIKDTLAGIDETVRFQDPAHRTDFGGAREPQDGVPDITSQSVRFLEVGGGTGTIVYDPAQSNTFPVGADGGTVTSSSFFYQTPGTITKYVTFAGYVRNKTSVALVQPTTGSATYLEQNNVLERGAFAYGERTATAAVPKSGSATFNGPMLASMVFNPLLDTDARSPTYFQWITGTSSTNVNFATNSVTQTLNGTVTAPAFDAYTSRVFTLLSGATFFASGSGTIDMVNAGGFIGSYTSAYFTQPNATRLDVNIAGSSLDGAFFGPAAQEVGGGFRIVGGTPDERIDILGTFTGKQ